jgi:tRNA nucleotidyltransferase (CCA-adding enzyme)
MDLIVTHGAADFDALSSLVAAKKLYPNSRLLLPGSQEVNVRQFLSLSKDLFDFESDKSCKIDDVTRVILVDTRHKSRIGKAAELIDKGKVEIIIYDHHPYTKYDIKPSKGVYKKIGATVTMLIEMIKEKGISLTPLESTLMALGIYEETGSLTYRTTTKNDVDAVSFLISRGANLGIVSSFLNRELSEDELSTLSMLINSTEVLEINGVNVAVSEISTDRYLGELGLLIHKLLDVENFKVIFAFVAMGKKILLIARSRTSLVDVNGILKPFGGGGHSAAASASIKGREIGEVRRELLDILKKRMRAKLYARDCMNKKIKQIRPDVKIEAAGRILEESKTGALLVMKGNKLLGILTNDNIKKAFAHDFGHSKVKGYMTTKIFPVKEKTTLNELRRIIFEKNVGYLPVMKNKKVLGLVTRTGILKTLFDSTFKSAKTSAGTKKLAKARHPSPNVLNKMQRMLPREVLSIIKRLAKLAEERQFKAYIVGGFVRDFLLGVKNLDVDLVVEGSAIEFAKFAAEKLDAALVVHKKFGTATLVARKPIRGTKFKIDIATARSETYKHPAALPSVQFGSIRDDLYRRDFTINAMAVSIDNKNFGELIDFFGGRKDLRGKKIKVLHDKSFIDDPTRIFRAVRFEQRYNFKIDSRTASLIKNAVKAEMFKKVSGERLREEIELLLKEKKPLKTIKKMRSLHELRFISPKIKFDSASEAVCKNVKVLYSQHKKYFLKNREIDLWLIYFMAIIDRLSLKQIMKVCHRFVMRRSDRLRLVSCKRFEDRVVEVLTDKRSIIPSRIYRTLEPLSYETLIFLMAKCGKKLIKKRITDFLCKYNGTRLKIKGQDLKRMGVKPGPVFTKILKKTLYAKIDGKLKSRKDELAFARKLAK